MDIAGLFRQMARARAFEDAISALWRAGRISGEMHLGTGEEAVAAGVVASLRPGDAVALDHRPTPVLTMLGVDLAGMLAEMLGMESGIQRGRAGHMHLMSRKLLAASSGIVGSSAPLGAGFALSGRALRPGSVAVAFFGDGAMNQGMLLETLNLAAAWSLPLLLVCKDNGWAITTRTDTVTGGDPVARARGFGLETVDVDGGGRRRRRRGRGRRNRIGLGTARAPRSSGPGFPGWTAISWATRWSARPGRRPGTAGSCSATSPPPRCREPAGGSATGPGAWFACSI